MSFAADTASSYSGPRVGIDFGTTNSSVARVTPHGVELVRFANDSFSSRSILYLEKAKKGILSSSGPAAIEHYLEAHRESDHPGRLIQSLKSYLPVKSLTGTEVFGRHYTLEDLVSRILIDLRERAEAQFAEPIRHATVGRPVKFVGAETSEDEAFAVERLRGAFLRAGFESVEFEFEPLAAAYAYQATLAHTETILIGDFGGGTSDFSLITVGPHGERKVLGNAGLPFAGDAFDARIVRKLIAPALGSESMARGMNKMLPAVPAWIYANLERWHYLSFLRTRNVLEILTTAQKRALEPEKIAALRALIDEDLGYQLHQAVQRTKNALSSAESAPFVFAGPEAGTLEIRTSVERSSFERWIAPELEQIEQSIEQLLRASGAEHGSIDRVFLTGGTSFVPAVRAIFERRFAGKVVSGNEFTSVAQGLALVRSA
jgi:hypothetical chaperone protein